jgi:hypothetical protein
MNEKEKIKRYLGIDAELYNIAKQWVEFVDKNLDQLGPCPHCNKKWYLENKINYNTSDCNADEEWDYVMLLTELNLAIKESTKKRKELGKQLKGETA